MSAPPRDSATMAAPTSTSTAARTLQLYVGGRWIDSTASSFVDVVNPARNELLARTPLGGAEDVDRAVQAALKAYPAWRATPPVQRVKFLFKFKNLLEANAEELAKICTAEHGKTIDESRNS